MKALAHRLRHRVDVQHRVESVDPVSGARSHAWQTIRGAAEPLLPAEIVPLSGREFVAAQSVQAGVTTRITMRQHAAMPHAAADAVMRVVHGAEVYNIRAVLPDSSLMRHVTLMCEAGVNAG